MQLAEKTGCEIKEPILAGNQKKGSATGAPALKFLEQHLYRSGKYARGVYQTIPEEISLHTAGNPGKEAEFAARTIWRLAREKGWHYGEMAVIAGDLKTYANPVRRAFARYEIPVFVDETRKILLNPALEFIKASLETARQNYSRESVMRFIRTGILNLTDLSFLAQPSCIYIFNPPLAR